MLCYHQQPARPIAYRNIDTQYTVKVHVLILSRSSILIAKRTHCVIASTSEWRMRSVGLPASRLSNRFRRRQTLIHRMHVLASTELSKGYHLARNCTYDESRFIEQRRVNLSRIYQ